MTTNKCYKQFNHPLDSLFGLPFTNIIKLHIYIYTYIYNIIIYIYIDTYISHVLDHRRAIDQLGASWGDSTVVDVGAGTGVLSVMCGKRAKKAMGPLGPLEPPGRR